MEKPHYHGEVCSVLPDVQIVLGVDLFPNHFNGGRGYVIDLTTWNTRMSDTAVYSVGLLCPDDARSLAGHLENAASLADRATAEQGAGIIGVRQLPTIRLCGRVFIIDERLRQLRNVANPKHSFDLDDPFDQ